MYRSKLLIGLGISLIFFLLNSYLFFKIIEVDSDLYRYINICLDRSIKFEPFFQSLCFDELVNSKQKLIYYGATAFAYMVCIYMLIKYSRPSQIFLFVAGLSPTLFCIVLRQFYAVTIFEFFNRHSKKLLGIIAPFFMHFGIFPLLLARLLVGLSLSRIILSVLFFLSFVYLIQSFFVERFLVPDNINFFLIKLDSYFQESDYLTIKPFFIISFVLLVIARTCVVGSERNFLGLIIILCGLSYGFEVLSERLLLYVITHICFVDRNLIHKKKRFDCFIFSLLALRFYNNFLAFGDFLYE